MLKGQNGHVLKRNVTKTVRKEQNGHISSEYATQKNGKKGKWPQNWRKCGKWSQKVSNNHILCRNVAENSGRHEKGRISGLAEAADLLEGLNLAKSSKSGIGWERPEQAGFGAEPQ